MSLSLPLVACLLLLAAASSGLAVGLAWAWLRRPELLARYLGLVERRELGRPAALFYAASHGELLLLERLLPLFQAEQPETEPIVIVPRVSVERVARQRLTKVRVECVWPVIPWGIVIALRRLAAEVFVVVEFARIPLWVRAARRMGVPVAIVNGRLSEKNAQRCAAWPWLFRPMLRAVDHVLVQTADDAERFLAHGARREAIEVVGPLKYDAASYNRNTFATRRLARLAGIAEDDVVLLAGSTREGEEAVVASIFPRLAAKYPRLRLIVVPRNHHRFGEVAATLHQRGIAFVRRSDLDSRPPTPETRLPSPRVLLVDTVGELAAWWGTAHVGFVGASLTSRGGQNMIEPAALGVATCFGPHTANFRDVVALLLEHEAAVQVADEAELEAFIRRCLAEPEFAAQLGRRAQQVCHEQTGAMARTCQRLSAILAEIAGPQSIRLPDIGERHGRRAA